MRRIEYIRKAARWIGLALAFAAAMPAAAQAPTWQLTGPEGGPTDSVAASRGAIVAGTSEGLYRSTDRAENWARVAATGYVRSMVASPHDPDFLVAAAGDALWRSTDGGVTWTATPVDPRLSELQFNPMPAHADELVAITTDRTGGVETPRLMRSLDRGLTWQLLTDDATFQPLGVLIDPIEGNYFAILKDGRLMLSSNRGISWRLLVHSLGQMPQSSKMMIMPRVGALLWSSSGGWVSYLLRYDGFDIDHTWTDAGPIAGLFADPLRSGRLWAASTSELFDERLVESLDFGATWKLVPSEHNVRLRAVLEDGTLVGSSMAGPLISTDAGRHWQLRSRGIRLAQVNSVAGHRSDGSLIAIAKGGAWVSTDRGTTWQAGSGIAGAAGMFSSLARHPHDPAIALASVFRTPLPAQTYRTTNGGLHWQPLPPGSGLSSASLQSIVYDPVDSSRVSATSESDRLFWSQDGGLHWQPVQTGIASLLVAAGGSSSRLYGLHSRTSWRGLSRAERPGATMTPITGVPALSALTVHPTASHILLASGEGTATFPVYLSTDGGDSWQTRGHLPGPLSSSKPQLAFDACDARAVYAFTNGVFYRSDNLGHTWQAEPLDMLVQGATAIVTGCAGGLSHVALSSNSTGGVRVRSPAAAGRISTNGFEPM